MWQQALCKMARLIARDAAGSMDPLVIGDVFFLVQHYFTVNFSHENQKALELRTEDAKDCDEWVAAIAHARYVPHNPTVQAGGPEPKGPVLSKPQPQEGHGKGGEEGRMKAGQGPPLGPCNSESVPPWGAGEREAVGSSIEPPTHFNQTSFFFSLGEVSMIFLD